MYVVLLVRNVPLHKYKLPLKTPCAIVLLHADNCGIQMGQECMSCSSYKQIAGIYQTYKKKPCNFSFRWTAKYCDNYLIWSMFKLLYRPAHVFCTSQRQFLFADVFSLFQHRCQFFKTSCVLFPASAACLILWRFAKSFHYRLQLLPLVPTASKG